MLPKYLPQKTVNLRSSTSRKMVLNMTFLDHDSRDVFSKETESIADEKISTKSSKYCPAIQKFLNKSAKKIIQIYEIPENATVSSPNAKRPKFTLLGISIALTFWCLFVFQMIAFLLTVVAYGHTQRKNYKKARRYKTAAWIMLLIGVIVFAAFLIYLFMGYSPPIDYEKDATYTRPCDPGCYYVELMKQCFC